MSRPRILGVPADPITFEDLFAQIETWISQNDGLHQVCTINPEFIMVAQHDPEFYGVLQKADLCVLDGWGAVWALRLRGVEVPQRVTGSDGVPMMMQRAAERGWRVFLLGAAEGVAEKAAQILQNRHPALKIVGTYAGSPARAEANEIIQRINAAQPDILLVAYGAPRQDVWIDRYRAKLNVKVAMGIGGTLDFITGIVPRAPQWLCRIGLEWLYRLYLQPARWRRMLRLPVFAVMAFLFRARPPKHARLHAHD